ASVADSGESVAAFQARASQVVKPNQTLVLAQETGGGYRAVAVVGSAFAAGQLLGGTLTPTLAKAGSSLTPTSATFNGRQTTIGWALGPPALPPGYVLYQQSTFSPFASNAVRQGPFGEIEAAIYSGTVARRSQLVLATTSSVPLHGQVVTAVVAVGSGRWLLAATARTPLVGRFATVAPLIILAMGLAVAIVVAAVIEVLTRRKRYAEQRVAEQRALLLDAQQELVESEAERARLDEIERIAGDLQESVVQRLLLVTMNLQAVAARHPEASAAIGPVIDDVDGTTRVFRTALFNSLSPADGEPSGPALPPPSVTSNGKVPVPPD
ncbi:MAG TPA: hypothetical protein VKY26_00835, partial [Actinomycetota bacterium]|nr:hypothetical protein [Actinomycetota bacterium]